MSRPPGMPRQIPQQHSRRLSIGTIQYYSDNFNRNDRAAFADSNEMWQITYWQVPLFGSHDYRGTLTDKPQHLKIRNIFNKGLVQWVTANNVYVRGFRQKYTHRCHWQGFNWPIHNSGKWTIYVWHLHLSPLCGWVAYDKLYAYYKNGCSAFK